MPELPEVETIARGLDKRVAGDVIESVWLGDKPQPLKSPAAEIADVLEHSRIVQVRRVGKHIVFDLESDGRRLASKSTTRTRGTHSEDTGSEGTRSKGAKSKKNAAGVASRAQWIVHLGMTGQLLIGPADAPLLETHARGTQAPVRTRTALRRFSPVWKIIGGAH